MIGDIQVVLGIQVLGIFFAIIMMYLTFHGYRRKQISKQGIILWIGVWVITLAVALFPQVLYGIMGTLSVDRTLDIVVILGFGFFAIMMFYLHQKINKMENKVDKLVRNLAFKEVEEEDK